MNFLIIGCGSIGHRHAKNLQLLGQTVYVYDKDQVRSRGLVEELGVHIYDFKSHHLTIDAFVICTPPNLHIPFAFEALEHNAHIFIEKPISHTLNRVDELIARCQKQERVLQVGYQLRFHSGLKKVKELLDKNQIGKLHFIQAEFGQYLPEWHPYEDYRSMYTCYKEQGGGIILDASHEIDSVLWLLGQSDAGNVTCVSSKLSGLDVDVEDTAEITLEFDECLAHIHLDMIQRGYTRKYKLIGQLGNIIWDYNDSTVLHYEWAADYGIYRTNRLFVPTNNPYLSEMRNFIASIEGKETPLVTGEQAKKVLEIALRCKENK